MRSPRAIVLSHGLGFVLSRPRDELCPAVGRRSVPEYVSRRLPALCGLPQMTIRCSPASSGCCSLDVIAWTL